MTLPIHTVKYSVEFLAEKAKWLEEVVAEAYSENPSTVSGPSNASGVRRFYVCPTARSHLFSCI